MVDDDEGSCGILRRRLERLGCAVTAAPDGMTAIAMMKEARFDLVMLDTMMPGVSGCESLRRIKADPALQDIPVIMISSIDDSVSVTRCIELGAEDYLTKPFDPVLLAARVSAGLARKRLHDAEARHIAELAELNLTLEARVSAQVAQMERLGRLKRFFSPHLAELIVSGGADDPLKTHRREITVVFLDLRGFTAFAELYEPEEVMGVLREYHGAMGGLVLVHEGTLERFTGDGMMIFFGDPAPVPNPAERAVRMAIAMQARFAALAEGWRKVGYDIGLGIGIAQGFATLGAIGFEGRIDYGAIGTVTNLAARLCAEAGPGEILVGQRVIASVEDLVQYVPAGTLALKGLSKPIQAFRVAGVR